MALDFTKIGIFDSTGGNVGMGVGGVAGAGAGGLAALRMMIPSGYKPYVPSSRADKIFSRVVDRLGPAMGPLVVASLLGGGAALGTGAGGGIGHGISSLFD